MLRRIGSKNRIAKDIINYFPPHNLYIEPMFGAGGIYFHKSPRVKTIANDIDKDIISFYHAVQEQREALISKLTNAIYHQDIFLNLKDEKSNDIVNKAFRFLYLTYTSLYSSCNSMRPTDFNWRKNIISVIDEIYDMLKDDICFMSLDYKDFFKVINIEKLKERYNAFCYLDPPYIDTDGRYGKRWNIEDFIEMIEIIDKTGIRWACSEFNNDKILDYCKQYNIYTIGERLNIKNNKVEILITNYELENKLF